MKTTEYLYGIHVSELKDMSYEEALRYKIECAEGIKKLCVHDARMTKNYYELYPRYAAAVKAIEFNRALLEELHGDQD